MRFIKTLKNLFGLPAGYTRLEYLASNGNQYIDTEYVMSDGKTMGFESDMMWTQSHGNANFFYGYRSVNSAEYRGDMRAFFIYGANPNGRLAIHYGVDSENSTQTAVSLNDKCKMTFDGTDLKVNGITYATHSQTYNPANYQSMWLFNCNCTGYYSADVSHFIGRIYRFKIFEDGVTVRDFVPCLDSFGKPCMYDLIERKAYYNKGTEEFTYGRQIIPVKYLQSSGNQYIDTGIKFDGANTKIEVKTYEDSLTRQHSICGDDGNYFYYFRGTGNWAVGYNGTASNIDSYMSVGDNVFVIDKNNVYVNDVLAKTYTASSTVSSYNTLLFNRKTSLVDKGAVTIYYCKIWNNDTLVRDYIPVKDENGIGFLFDKVNNGVYLNAGSDAFITGDNVYQPLLRFIVDNNRVVPTGFKEVEYLESTGTQYIDTGYIASNTSGFKVDIMPLQATDKYFIGSRPRTVTNDRWLAGSNTGLQFYIGWNTNTFVNWELNKVHTVQNNFMNSRTKVLDGTVVAQISETLSSQGTRTVYLFSANDANAVSMDTCRIYKVQISDGSSLVRDFIPCIDPLGVPCMFDLVGKKPYYNAGSGTFTLGRQVIPVEYLESTGTQYIDTGVSTAEGICTEVKFKINTITSASQIIFGKVGSTTPPMSRYWFGAQGSSLKWYYAVNEYVATSANADADIHTVVLDTVNNVCTLDGETLATFSDLNSNSETISLFSAFYQGSLNNPMSGRIYYTKIWNNGTLVRSFIPVRDENNVGYMFDKVSHTLYSNAGTGSFMVGDTKKELTFRLPKDPIPREYQIVSYLESSGTQYIDTGFVPTSDNFQFEIRMLSQNTSAYIGYRSVNSGTATGDMRWFFNYDSGRVAIRYGDTSENSTLFFDTQTTHKFYFNGSSLYVDDVNYLTTTKKYATPLYKSFYLFSVNTSGYYSADIANFVGRIYYTKIWDNGILIRNFVPVIRKSDSVAGMYDIVTKQFFENQGTGTFNYG